MGKLITKIGPDDNGRRMSLEEFENAEVDDGPLYELSRGVVTVVEVPKRRHMAQVIAVRRQLTALRSALPRRRSGHCGRKRVQAARRRSRFGAASRPCGLPDAASGERGQELLAPLDPRARHRGRFAQLAAARLPREAGRVPAFWRQGVLDRGCRRAGDGRDAALAGTLGRNRRTSAGNAPDAATARPRVFDRNCLHGGGPCDRHTRQTTHARRVVRQGRIQFVQKRRILAGFATSSLVANASCSSSILTRSAIPTCPFT